MEIVLKLLDWSLRQNWALGGPIVCFIVLMCIPALRNTADNPSDRAYWRDLLRHDRPAERYRSVMRRGLDWLDSRLSAHEAPQGPAQRAWSFGLLNATMALALAYPILAITIQWLCGSAIDFGGQEVIAASPPQARIFTAVWLGSSLFFYLFAGASKSRWRWTLVILATGILLLGSIYADRFAVPGMSQSQAQSQSQSQAQSQAQSQSQPAVQRCRSRSRRSSRVAESALPARWPGAYSIAAFWWPF